MQLPGLITVQPKQVDIINKLSHMMGRSFLEELWTKVWLESLNPLGEDDARRLEISRAIMKYDFIVGAPHECCYMLPDMAAGIGGYLSSDLQEKTWGDLEDEATAMMFKATLTQAEQNILVKRADEMSCITNFTWMIDHANGADFIHFFSIGVNPDMRGSGAFRKILTPFLDYADEHKINCYLECYRDHLEGLYGHFGFETVHRFSDPAFDISERAMARLPR